MLRLHRWATIGLGIVLAGPAPVLAAEPVGQAVHIRTSVTGDGEELQVQDPVHREERISTSAGDADCWVVLLRAGAMEERLWVDKGKRVVVRSEQVTGSGRLVAEL